MPSKSKSQQRLFGMVHAYQKGQLKNPPSKIKHVGSHISSTSATHFAATKTKSLPNHVKKAGWYNDFRKSIPGHHPHTEGFQLSDIDKKACKICECGNPNEYHTHEEFKKNMDKQAFERGFIKAAIDNGVDPLLATQLLKNANSIAQQLQDLGGVADPGILETLKLKAMAETGGGAALGAAGGAMLGGGVGYLGGRNKEHPEHDHSVRNMLLLGALGGGVGAIGGGTAGGMHGGGQLADYIKSHPFTIQQ